MQRPAHFVREYPTSKEGYPAYTKWFPSQIKEETLVEVMKKLQLYENSILSKRAEYFAPMFNEQGCRFFFFVVLFFEFFFLCPRSID